MLALDPILCNVRLAIPNDYEVIGRLLYWSRAQVQRTLCSSRPFHVALVAEHERSIAGVIAYQIRPGWLDIAGLAVRPDVRRRGIATQLIQQCRARARQRLVAAEVDECDVRLQLTLRANGFEVVRIRHCPFG